MTIEEKNANLRNALAQCLELIHNFFGLTDAEMQVALDDAEVNPGWTWADDKTWHRMAHPPGR